MENTTPFYLTKVAEKKWADKLLDGEVFMRPLSDFSDLMRRPDTANNAFRGDPLEGVSESFGPSGDGSTFFKEALGTPVTGVAGTGLQSQAYQQERIIFSMFCFEFSEEQSAFIAPADELRQFGDTAIIIFDPKQFIYRICYSLFQQFNENYWIGAKRVKYDVELSKPDEYDEFSKRPSYSWQNEFRFALDLSEGTVDRATWESMTDFARIMFMNQGGRVNMGAERKPLILNIGDIRDISVKIPTTELIGLKLPLDRFLRPPSYLPPFEPPRKQPSVTAFRPVIQVEGDPI